jgi:hypothetical protein
MYAVMSVVLLVVVIGALADIITRQEWQVKHLPKMVWVLLVVLLPLVGSILWFAVGREYDTPVDRGSFGDPRRREQFDDADFRTRTTEQELADLDREIEYHSKQAEIDRLEALLLERRLDDDAR